MIPHHPHGLTSIEIMPSRAEGGQLPNKVFIKVHPFDPKREGDHSTIIESSGDPDDSCYLKHVPKNPGIRIASSL